MFRGIVLGDFGGIEKSVWVDLWAGLLGAIPAAVLSAAVAAWVAVSVLNRSNKHQKKLARKQLKDQRAEAEKVRRTNVLADLLGVVNGFQASASEGAKAVNEQLRIFDVHAYRWALEGSDLQSDLVMLRWGNVLWKPALAIAELESLPEGRRKQWEEFLRDAQGALTSGCLGLGLVGEKLRASMLAHVAEDCEKYERRWKKLEKVTGIAQIDALSEG